MFDRQSVNESVYSVVGMAARANFDALAGGGVNAQLGLQQELFSYHFPLILGINYG